MKANSERKAVVVGAGLVGSLWAIFLARKGYTVEVFERRSDMRLQGYYGGRSINLAMSHRGWHAVEMAGIRPQLEKVAIPMPGRMIHHATGSTSFQPYGKTGEAIYSVSRGGLNLELLKLADEFPNVTLHFDHRCTDVDLHHDEISFENTATGEKTSRNCPLIFGTDGAFSAVRYSLQKTDRFDYAQKYLDHGYKELTIPAGPNGQHQLEKNALHIWPRGNFMLIALANADGSFTCTLFLPFEGEFSFEKLNTEADVRAFFEQHFPDSLPYFPTLEADFFKNPTSSLVTVRCSPWQHNGKVCLLGDAAHAIVPFFGQGMNAGFEDCTILDSMIEAYDHDWSRILPAFSDQRKRDGDAIADLALRNFIEMRDLVADPKFLLRKKIAAHLHEKFPEKFMPVYSMVTFSNTPYHQAIAEDDAQNQFFAEVLALPDIENQWDGPAVDQLLDQWLLQKKGN